MTPDMEKRIEAAARAMAFDDGIGPFEDLDEDMQDGYRETIAIILRAAFPELFTDPPSHWLAPHDYTEEMTLAAVEACAKEWPRMPHFQGDFERGWIAMRDAYLASSSEATD